MATSRSVLKTIATIIKLNPKSTHVVVSAASSRLRSRIPDNSKIYNEVNSGWATAPCRKSNDASSKIKVFEIPRSRWRVSSVK